jgi:voltage-gated potassium channel
MPPSSVSPHRLAELDPRQRRWAVTRSGLTVALTWVVLFGGFYLTPDRHFSNGVAILRLAVALIGLVVVMLFQARQISRSELPELRAIEGLAILIALFLVVFSTVYLTLSTNTPGTFSQGLDHTRALYFTITVFSTVGFGDITPRTDPARLIVAAQMLLDLVIIGAVVRLLFSRARSGLERRDDGGTTSA